MSQFISSIFSWFFPVILLLTFLWFKHQTEILTKFIFSSGYILAGVLLAETIPISTNGHLVIIIVTLVALLFLALSYRAKLIKLGHLSHALLLFSSGWYWDWENNNLIISTTKVVDPELIQNVAAILAAWGIIFLTAWCLYKLIKHTTVINPVIIIALFGVILYPLSGELVRLISIYIRLDLPDAVLSYIGKATYFPIYNTYISLCLVAILISYYLFNQVFPLRRKMQTTTLIAKRRATANYLTSRRLFIANSSLATLAIAIQAYWDFIGSRPIALSQATQLFADKHGWLNISVDSVKDGYLHRFMWVASDGHLIRFFVINKKPQQLDLITLFDACMLCGDKGYIMRGNQLYCAGCNVRLYIPSLGTSGGCNPLLIEEGGWSYDQTTLTVKTQALANGSQYFSTILTIEVKDPVDGTKLTNESADFSYNLDGVSYFFSSKKNYALFIANPDHYLNRQPAD